MPTATSTANKKDIDIPVGFETDPAEDALAREALTTARVALLLKASFFGNMATRLPLVNSDEWLPTAATDGRYFYYNSKFILMLKPKEIEFLFGHETLHNVYDHLGRSKFNLHNPTIANIAADYAVNRDLVNSKIGTMITTVPALYDRKYEKLSMEEIYDDIYDNAEKIDLDQLADMLLDEHLDADDGEGGNGDSPEEDENGNLKSKNKPKYSKEDRKKIRDEIKESLINSAKQAGNAAGDIPGDVARIIRDLTEPQMVWTELLETSIQSTVKSDYSFMRPSRKGWGSDFMLPGMVPENTIEAAIAMDMSGSISNDMGRDMLSEVKGIMEQFQDFKIKLWCFDTQVYNYAEFDNTNIDDILSYEPKGGGGTDFDCNWKFMKENDICPERFIMFTDGYPYSSWGDPDYCDTVFIIHGPDTIKPPFGNYAYYKFKDHQ